MSAAFSNSSILATDLVLHFYFLNVAFSTFSSLFFFNDTATTEIYTLSLHDALPISHGTNSISCRLHPVLVGRVRARPEQRSEEHTSELQSRENLVCRLLLEKKKKKKKKTINQKKIRICIT